MSLIISDTDLAEHRADALAEMRSRVRVLRRNGLDPQDEGTGVESPHWDVEHDDIPFRLGGSSSGGGSTHEVTIGGVTYHEATAIGHFAHDTVNLQDGDHILILVGEWAGSVYRIIEASKKDRATARRVPIAETPRPREWPS